MQPQSFTYKHLLERQDFLTTTGQLNGQTAANRATVLRKFLRVNNVAVDDVVGSEMRMHFPECSERFVRSLQEAEMSTRNISNTKAALTPWREMVVEHDAASAIEAGKPTPFQTQLREMLGSYAVKHVAKHTRVPYDMLLGWLKGKVPRASNAKFIARLEGFFAIQPGSLAALAGVSHAPRLRPDAVEPKRIEYRESLGARTKHQYWFRPGIDSELRRQWVEFMRYKTANVPALERSSKGQWRFSPLPLGRQTEYNWYLYLDGVEVASAEATWAKVGSYLGWLNLSPEQGGMGIPAEQLHTLAWLVLPDFIQAYVEWRKVRAGGKHNSSTPQFLGWLLSLVRADVGYFPQCEWLRDTLPEKYRNVDWGAMCTKQAIYCRKFTHSLKGQIEVSRDPFEPIEHIVDLPEPMEALVDMVQRMRAERPIGNLMTEAIWARDLVMVKLLASNPLRRRQYAHLEWKADNTGHLHQKADGSWWIKWKARYFKNAIGAAGDGDYNSPVHETVWPDIERYLFKHRPTLMRCQTDLVFLARTKSEKNAGLPHSPWADLSRRIEALTRRHLLRCDGVGTHSFRHIVGSSIVKAAPGEMHTAAKVLNDRVSTVEKHYARFTSGDGARRMGDLLGKSFRRM